MQFCDEAAAAAAVQRSGSFIGQRYIELLQCNVAELPPDDTSCTALCGFEWQYRNTAGMPFHIAPAPPFVLPVAPPEFMPQVPAPFLHPHAQHQPHVPLNLHERHEHGSTGPAPYPPSHVAPPMSFGFVHAHDFMPPLSHRPPRRPMNEPAPLPPPVGNFPLPHGYHVPFNVAATMPAAWENCNAGHRQRQQMPVPWPSQPDDIHVMESPIAPLHLDFAR